MTEWQPMETAPKDGTYIMAWGVSDCYDGPVAIYWHTRNECWASDPNEGWYEESILGWQPLPDRPKKLHYCEGSLGFCIEGKCVTAEDPLNRNCLKLIVSEYGMANENKEYVSCKHYSTPRCPFCGEKA